MTPEELHRREVQRRVQASLSQGILDLGDILRSCEGADPALVADCVKRLGASAAAVSTSSTSHSRELLVRLPAPDPSRSQWWFTGETVDYLSKRVVAIAGDGRILCLGTPTLGHELLSAGVKTLVLDVDPHVVKAVTISSSDIIPQLYDVSDALAPNLHGEFRVAVVDPPWYDDVFRTFVGRALDALGDDGELLCTLPPRLTRPGIDDFRRELISEIVNVGCEVLGLENGRIGYVVPRFEEVALKRIEGFQPMPWRRADLLHIRKPANSKSFAIPTLKRTTAEIFSRSPHEFRVFLRSQGSLGTQVVLEPLELYTTSVSVRAHVGEIPDLWTTEKFGARIGQFENIREALQLWEKLDVSSTAEAVLRMSERTGPDVAKNVINELDRQLGLWTNFASMPPLRSDDEIEAAKKKSLTHWATASSPREHSDGADVFRGRYQRDRDRVLWSSGLRRLAHKTQLFPTEHDDQLRQRLAHSIEVMQLASTIGASFGLDRDLIEAGALAHDIGHTPFGHAGEHALDHLLNTIDEELGGFNHYEHGVDVVRWLEGPYSTSHTLPFHGLNLTPEVAECILKHTYCQGNGPLSSDHVYETSKHSSFIPRGHCHLEGQAVRVADKISYFVSDLEDGIRLGAISVTDLLSCRFFHRAPLNFSIASHQTLYPAFIEQRRNVLKILMEDILVSTNKRLARIKPQEVRNAAQYTVNHSEEILSDMNQVWVRLQKGKLHEDRRVKLANLRAARIVSDLTVVFAVCPQLVDAWFAIEHARLHTKDYMKQYRRRAGDIVSIPAGLIDFLSLEHMIGSKHEADRPMNIPIEHMIQAKDFVAGLTDSRARSLHSELFGVS